MFFNFPFPEKLRLIKSENVNPSLERGVFGREDRIKIEKGSVPPWG